MARATQPEIDQLRNWLLKVEEYIEQGFDNSETLADLVCDRFPQWRRTVEGYQDLIDNVCDPALDYLDWKLELKAVIEDRPCRVS